MINKIAETTHLSVEDFHNHVVTAGQPLVIRGLVNDWPIVQAGKESALAFCNYLRRFDRGVEVNTAFGPPAINGRIFYNNDMSGLNCRMGNEKLATSLNYLLEHFNDDPAPMLAIQSVVVPQYLPGMQLENRLGLLPNIEPRIWIGGKATVAAHYDPSENIACCLAGKRRFTLFPPSQIANLYVGPFEFTPSGTTVSMVDFDNPDYDKFPNFKLAEQHALQAELEPGDAIYIPYLWWHHVKALEGINALMNYWWGKGDEQRGEPRNALLMSIMAIRDLPEHHKKAWQEIFNHYVFSAQDTVSQHIPKARRGILGELTPDLLRTLRKTIVRVLSRID